jgi:hypothetical protein
LVKTAELYNKSKNIRKKKKKKKLKKNYNIQIWIFYILQRNNNKELLININLELLYYQYNWLKNDMKMVILSNPYKIVILLYKIKQVMYNNNVIN